jgi:hypothetical protein
MSPVACASMVCERSISTKRADVPMLPPAVSVSVLALKFHFTTPGAAASSSLASKMLPSARNTMSFCAKTLSTLTLPVTAPRVLTSM